MYETVNMRGFSHADATAVLGERPPFLVDGVLRPSLNLIYGQPDSGKSVLTSVLAAALLNGESHFLGREILQPHWSIGMLLADYGDAGDYKTRLDRMLTPGTEDQAYYYEPLEAPPDVAIWKDILHAAVEQQHSLLIVDNLSFIVEGSLNYDADVKPTLNALGAFINRGITVVAIAHASEKRGVHGGVSHHPIGSTLLRGRARWQWEVQKRDDRDFQVDFRGRQGEPHRITARCDDWNTYKFSVTGAADAAKIRPRRRNGADLDQKESFILSECQPLNGKQTAVKLAERFGGEPKTHETYLSRGKYHVQRVDGAWVPKAA
jgi:hypothetical protein